MFKNLFFTIDIIYCEVKTAINVGLANVNCPENLTYGDCNPVKPYRKIGIC